MRKLLFILLFGFIGLIGNAQNNYNYLECEFNLFKIQSELDIFNNQIKIDSQGILIDMYHSNYDGKLGDLRIETYNAYYFKFDALKRLYKETKELINLKIKSSKFTDAELDVIKSSFNNINSSIELGKQNIKIHNILVQKYNELSKQKYVI